MELTNYHLPMKNSSLPFIVGTFSDVINTICKNILAKKSFILLPCSLNDLASISASPTIAKTYRLVDVCTTDGMPTVWLTQFKSHQKVERVYGPDLTLALCQNRKIQTLRHVFYGSSEQTLANLDQKLHKIAPKLKVVGMISPPMHRLSSVEENGYIKQIKKLKPDILWIGLSSPLQIEVASHFKKFFPHTTFMCVGAAFDFVSESKAIAPKWMKKSGLEWLFRLRNEPQRLWKRYLVTIPKFLLLHGFELIFNP